MLWFLIVFNHAPLQVEMTTNHQFNRKKYHLPLDEREFALSLYDKLSRDECIVNTDGSFTEGWYTEYIENRSDKGADIPKEIFRDEISTEGLMYFGLIKSESVSKKSNQTSSEGCYIATCVYNSYDCPEVWTLRRFRDKKLASSVFGRLFIKWYYAVSPIIVRHVGKKRAFINSGKWVLDKIIKILNKSGFESSPYKDSGKTKGL